MGLKTVLWAGVCVSLILMGCSDMFSTTPITAKPDNINDYSSSLSNSKGIQFEVEEYLEALDGSEIRNLKTMNLEFRHLSDTSFQALAGAKLKLTAKNLSDGSELWYRNMYVYFNETQLEQAAGAGEVDMGPHFFYLGTIDSNNISDFTNTLPILAEESEKIQFSRNLFQITRQLGKPDTLKFKNSLEETWVVYETWTSKGQIYMEATYWYGASGLLKCRQLFSEIRETNASGKFLGSQKFIREFRLL